MIPHIKGDAPSFKKYVQEIRVLKFGSTPAYWFLKSTNEKHNYFQSSTFGFFLLSFYCKYETSTANNYAECFSWGLKITKKTIRKKLKPLHHIWLAIALTKISNFLFSLFKFVAFVAANRADTPTSKKNFSVNTPYWSWKVLIEQHKFFDFQILDSLFCIFNVNMNL